MKFLVAKGLDGCSVEDTATGSKAVGNLIFADECLSAACLGGHEYIFAATYGGDGVLLEVIERI